MHSAKTGCSGRRACGWGARQLVAGHARDALAQHVQRRRVVRRAVQQVGQLVCKARGLLPRVQPGVRAQERRQRRRAQPRPPAAARCLQRLGLGNTGPTVRENLYSLTHHEVG